MIDAKTQVTQTHTDGAAATLQTRCSRYATSSSPCCLQERESFIIMGYGARYSYQVAQGGLSISHSGASSDSPYRIQMKCYIFKDLVGLSLCCTLSMCNDLVSRGLTA